MSPYSFNPKMAKKLNPHIDFGQGLLNLNEEILINQILNLEMIPEEIIEAKSKDEFGTIIKK